MKITPRAHHVLERVASRKPLLTKKNPQATLMFGVALVEVIERLVVQSLATLVSSLHGLVSLCKILNPKLFFDAFIRNESV